MEQNNLANVTTEKKGERLTAVWRNGGCSASYEKFVEGSSEVI